MAWQLSKNVHHIYSSQSKMQALCVLVPTSSTVNFGIFYAIARHSLHYTATRQRNYTKANGTSRCQSRPASRCTNSSALCREVRDWEQGSSQPDRPAWALLQVIEAEPEVVQRVLEGAE